MMNELFWKDFFLQKFVYDVVKPWYNLFITFLGTTRLLLYYKEWLLQFLWTVF